MVGISRAGVAKMFWAMNIAPPVKEDHYEEINRKLLLPCIKKFQYESMQATICKHFYKEIARFYFILCYFLLDDAVDDNDGDPTHLTVSGDRTW